MSRSSRDHATSDVAQDGAGVRRIRLRTVWAPKQRHNVMGGRLSDLYVSHWNRERPSLLVGFNMQDGKPSETSRVSIHPEVLLAEYTPKGLLPAEPAGELLGEPQGNSGTNKNLQPQEEPPC